jgi:hypothetical protein
MLSAQDRMKRPVLGENPSKDILDHSRLCTFKNSSKMARKSIWFKAGGFKKAAAKKALVPNISPNSH